MKTATLAFALLAFAGAAHSQVMVETVAERKARCEATMPQLLTESEMFVSQFEANESAVVAAAKNAPTPIEAANVTTKAYGSSRATERQLKAIAEACRVAAPAIGERAQTMVERLYEVQWRILETNANR